MKGSISCTFFESYSNVLNLNLGISGEKGRVREKKTRGVGQEEGARGHAGRRERGHRGQAVQGEPGEGDPGRDRGAAGAEGEHRDGPQAKLERLKPAMEDPCDSAHDYATELNKWILYYFAFVLEPK